MRPPRALLPLVACAACASGPDPAPGPGVPSALDPAPDTPLEPALGLPPDAHRMLADHAPTPFSAAQIEAACAPGAFRTFTITASGQTQRTRMVFGEPVDGKAVVANEVLDATGAVAMRQEAPPMGWDQLQGHASFPEALVQLTVVTDQPTVAGVFDGWCYVVTAPNGAVTSFTFAHDLPGPPVLMTAWEGGFETQRMELVDYGPR